MADSEKAIDIVVIGSCNVDLISYVKNFPRAGETLCGTKFAMGCGGKGANQCVIAAKLGAKTTMVACIGNDTFGQMFKMSLKDVGVDTSCLNEVEGATTGVATITVDEKGENQIVIVKGANNCLSEELVQQSPLLHAKVALFQMEISQEVTLQSLKSAHSHGVTTIFNPAPASSRLPDEFLNYTTVLCCNETEAELLTGLTLSSRDQYMDAVRRLLLRGPERVVLTLGGMGAMFGEKGCDVIQHVDVKGSGEVVDTTGAGDCFVGSLAYYMACANQLPFTEVVRRAVHIATMSVAKLGTQSSYPNRNELPEFLF